MCFIFLLPESNNHYTVEQNEEKEKKTQLTFPPQLLSCMKWNNLFEKYPLRVSEHTDVALVMTDKLLILPDTEVAAVSQNIQDNFFF